METQHSGAVQEHNQPQNLRRRLTAAVLAGTLLFGASASEGHDEAHQGPVSAIELMPDAQPIPPYTTDYVHSFVKGKTTDTVEKLLAQPTDPDIFDEFKKAQDKLSEITLGKEGKISPEASYYNYLEAQYVSRKAMADKYGVTIYDPTDSVTAMQQGLHQGAFNKKPLPPFSFFFSEAKNYLGRFGIDLTIADDKTKGNGEHAMNIPTAAELEAYETKERLTQLVASVSLYTQEYVDLANNGKGTRVSLAANPDSSYAAFTNPKTHEKDEITLNISQPWFDQSTGVNVMDHELYHDVHHALYGDIYSKDPGFEVFSGTPYKDTIDPRYTLDTLKAYTMPIDTEVLNARGRGDFKQACVLQASINQYVDEQGPDVAFATRYGGSKNVLEDRAELGQSIPGGKYSTLLSESMPRIRAKFVRIVSELETIIPRTMSFFIAMAERKPYAFKKTDCNQVLHAKGG